MIRRPPRSTLFPTRRSSDLDDPRAQIGQKLLAGVPRERGDELRNEPVQIPWPASDAENLARSLLRSEEHTSELQSQSNLVCRLLLEKKKKNSSTTQAGRIL